MKFIIYKDKKGEYRWTLKARNGRKIADSAEGYKSRWNCTDRILSIQQAFESDNVQIFGAFEKA